MDTPSLSQPGEAARTSWFDLFLYLASGFGIFLTAGFLLRGPLRSGTLAGSALNYTLNILCFGGTVLLMGVRRRKLDLAEIGFWPPRWRWGWLGLALGIVAVLNPLRIGIALAAEAALTGSLQALTQSFRMQIFAPGGFTWAGLAVTLGMAGLLAPAAEELFFRGAIYSWFRQRAGIWVSVLASSALFALGHADTFAVVITSFILGAVNALVFERTRSLWASIAIHAVNNCISVILVYAALAAGMGR